MSENRKTDTIPESQKLFGNVIYWTMILAAVTALFAPVFILANPTENMLDPNLAFQAIFDGADPEEIWVDSAYGEFPGGHFYLKQITMPDGWAMILICISCAFGLFGLTPAVLYQATREKDWFCAILGTIIIALIFLSVIGVLSISG